MRSDISPTVHPAQTPPRSRRFGLWLLGPAVAVLALGGASISAAHAQAAAEAQGQELDPTDAGAMAGGFMAHRMEKLLDQVGATASQRSQIEGIWSGLRPQLKALHQQHRALHKQMVGALTAATIDPSAVEQLRKQGLSLTDQTSTLFTQGVVQSAQVLTAAQRQQLQTFLAQEHGRFHHHGGQP